MPVRRRPSAFAASRLSAALLLAAVQVFASQIFAPSARAQAGGDSKLIGASVITSDEQLAGAVDDVVAGQNGQSMLVIGLAGYLGLGEKDVAIPTQPLQTSRLSGIPRVFVNGRYGGARLDRVHVPMTLKELAALPALTAPSGAGQPSTTSTAPAVTPKAPPSSTQSGGPG